MVFVLYKKEAARVENMLQRRYDFFHPFFDLAFVLLHIVPNSCLFAERGWKAVSVHGDKAQHERTKALCLFKEGKCPLMVSIDAEKLKQTLSLIFTPS